MLFVSAVVLFHLFVLVVRNPLDLWSSEIEEALRDQQTVFGMAGPGQPGWGGLVASAEDVTPSPRPPASLWETEQPTVQGMAGPGRPSAR